MLGVSRYTVAEYLRRAGVVGITWPVPPELDDVALERKLFTPAFGGGEPSRPQPDWSRLHAELRRPGVTLLLVWEEYRAGQPDGYGYAVSATSTPPGAAACRQRCARTTRPGSDCLSTMPDRRSR